MMKNSKYLFLSKRLGLREWRESDISKFAKINADKEVMEFFPYTPSYEQTEKFIQKVKSLYAETGYTLFAVDYLEENEFIGFIGFWYQSYDAFFTPCVEIGWRLDKKYWGLGLASEGAARCLEYGFEELGLKEICSLTSVINKRSERVMQKIGMKKVGEFEHPKIEKSHKLCKHVLYKVKR